MTLQLPANAIGCFCNNLSLRARPAISHQLKILNQVQHDSETGCLETPVVDIAIFCHCGLDPQSHHAPI